MDKFDILQILKRIELNRRGIKSLTINTPFQATNLEEFDSKDLYIEVENTFFYINYVNSNLFLLNVEEQEEYIKIIENENKIDIILEKYGINVEIEF